MNYRHAFHAGNFADVLKHWALLHVLDHLRKKPTPFFVLDTHAGAGRYDLASAEARRTGEAAGGIVKLLAAPSLPPALGPYLDLVRRFAAREGVYPGSPKIVRARLRVGDRLLAMELHPEDERLLKRAFAGDPLVEVRRADGFAAMKAVLPPAERRGLVLVDPAFEAKGEFRRLAAALGHGVRRWATGSYLVWYPIKDRDSANAFLAEARTLRMPKTLRAELRVAPESAPGLAACGLLAVNPPHTMEAALGAILPCLVERLGQDDAGAFTLDWLVTESKAPSVSR